MSSTNPFDPAGHLASLWGRSGDALLDAQRSLVQELAGWMPSVAPEPAVPDDGYEAARRAFAHSWETALDVSRAAAANLSGSGDPALAATLDRLLDPAAWFAHVSGREPRPGDIAPTASLAEAATLVERRRLEHDVVLVEAWMQAAGAFARALHAAAGQGAAPASPEAVTALWSEHADPIFAEAERSDAFRRSREGLGVARAELDAAQRAAGRIYGYATRQDLDDLRGALDGLRRRIDEVTAPPEPVAVDVSAPVRPVEPEPRPEIPGPPPRYTLRSHGREGPALILVGQPGDPAARDVADSLARRDMAVHQVVWSEAAWRGALDDLVRDLASALDDLVREVAPVALVGVGPGAIPLACLAARRDIPALVVVEAAFAFDAAVLDGQGPDWLAGIQREDALVRGTLAVDGEPIELSAITCPVLNLMPAGIDSPEAARALAHLVASDDYAEHPLPSPGEAGPALADWLTDGPGSDRDGPTSSDRDPRDTKSLEKPSVLGHMGSAE